jgi:hypoxanthine phosphoribosyltransferase
MELPEGVESVLFTEEDVKLRVAQLGKEITSVYRGTYPLLVGVLRGAIVFMADLMREIEIPVEIDFIRLSSYSATESSGQITLHMDCGEVSGRDVLIVEDIVDTGRTLSWLKDHLLRKGAATVRTVVLTDKKERRVVPFAPEFVGWVIPDRHVIGYGYDLDGLFRNMRFVGILDEKFKARYLAERAESPTL